MKNEFICYKGCTTCKSAEKYLIEKGVEFIKREITIETPTVSELKLWHKESGLDLKKFFNTRGESYRNLNLKETYDGLSDEERYTLLSKDGMLIKRPLMIINNHVLLGFKKEAIDEIL